MSSTFQNKSAILIGSHFFERDLRKAFNRRCDYEKLLHYLTADDQSNIINNENRITDLVRATYFYSQTILKEGHFVKRDSPTHQSFLNALRNMGYEIDGAYNNIDAHLTVNAIQLAESGVVDTILMLGITVDHVPLIWHLRSCGVRVIGMFSDTYTLSERIKDALHWYHKITVEDGFLTDELSTSNAKIDDAEPEQLSVDR